MEGIQAWVSTHPEAVTTIVVSALATVAGAYLFRILRSAESTAKRAIQHLFASDLRARITIGFLLLIADIAVLLRGWDWNAQATVSDVAAVSSLVMAFWYLTFKIDSLIKQALER
ncbi:hypothetical protein DF121_34135 [Burkholderia stagnalis]|nr:hypothetical protein DF145_33660 [Burkholderia stagnalis]RQX87126.1 hypothetical protein DF121_34135 [Burkholderia stagnalis]RQY07214.1 hypothetical protein DF115_34165 [Burkholderia stagnalis]RQY22294.1 hypothetical protein DF114_34075 [Burkholderia stagnalis]